MLTEEQIRKKVRLALIEKHNKFLLKEYEHRFFEDVKKAFSNFFSAISGSAKLVSRSMILWMDVNFPFSPFKKKSTYEKMFAEYERDQKVNQQQIEKAMNGMSEDGLGWLLPLAPGAVLSAYAFKTVRGLGTSEFKGFMDSSGLGRLPGVRQVLNADPTQGWFREPKEDGTMEDRGFLSAVFEEIQGIFLLSPIFEGVENKRVLTEAEETKSVIDKDVEHVMNLLDKMEVAGAWESIEKIGKKRLQTKKEFIEKIMTPIVSALEVSEIIINSKSPDEFSERIASSNFKDLKSMNTSSMIDNFYKTFENIKADPKKMKELQKALKTKNVQPDDEDWDDHAVENLWNLGKAEMAQRALANQEETYEKTKELITENLTPEHFDILSKSETGREYVSLIQESMNKLNNSINKS